LHPPPQCSRKAFLFFLVYEVLILPFVIFFNPAGSPSSSRAAKIAFLLYIANYF
jgi:NADH:ubiquinone oxidoreductase subunit 4 (subunit M)